MQLETPRIMKKRTSQSAVSSSVFTSGAVGTVANLGRVFGRPNKSTQRLTGNAQLNKPRFRMFRSSKNSARRDRIKFIPPPNSLHPIIVDLDAALHDDDSSSVCSEDTTSSCRSDAPVSCLALQWENSSSVNTVNSDYLHAVLEVDGSDETDEEWNGLETQTETVLLTPPPSLLQPASANYHRRPSLPGPVSTRMTEQAHRLHSMSLDNLPNSLYHQQAIASESWDKDFELDATGIQVPSSVEDAQLSIRMDMYNIRDFTSQIETLKSLRAKRNQLYDKLERTWPGGIARSSRLESVYRTCWEEADAIIDLSDATEDNQPTFDDARQITVDVNETVSSDRHLQVLKRLFVSDAGDDTDCPFLDVDDDSSDDDSSDGDSTEAVKSVDDDDVDEEEYVILSSTLEIPYEYDNLDRENCVCVPADLDESAREKLYEDEDVMEKTRKRLRSEKVRVSVEDVPGLVGRLRELYDQLSQHVEQLSTVAGNDQQT